MQWPSAKGMRGRTVPWLHQARMELVEGALVGRHVGPLLPRLRDHGHDRLREAAPGHEQELEHVVEVPRVRTVGLDDREELLQFVPEQIRAQDAFAGVHPVAVAQQRVDLAVVAHGAVGLGAVPRREGVRGEARVHHRHVGLVVPGAEIVEELEELMGRQHPLVDDGVGRQRAEVGKLSPGEARIAPQAVAGEFADDVELAFEGAVGEAFAGPDEELLEVRHRRERGRGQPRPFGAEREPAPSQAALSLPGDDALGTLLANLPLPAVAREKGDTDSVLAGRGKGDAQLFPGHPVEEPVRQPGEEPGPVARSGFAADPAAVPHTAVDLVGVVEDGPARPPADVADEADPAALVFVAGVVQTPGGRQAEAECGPCVHRAPASVLLDSDSRAPHPCVRDEHLF